MRRPQFWGGIFRWIIGGCKKNFFKEILDDPKYADKDLILGYVFVVILIVLILIIF